MPPIKVFPWPDFLYCTKIVSTVSFIVQTVYCSALASVVTSERRWTDDARVMYCMYSIEREGKRDREREEENTSESDSDNVKS